VAKRYTEKEKQIIVKQYLSGESASGLCQKHGIARSSLYLWSKQYSDVIPESKTAREIYLLEQEVKRLRVQNEIFRLSECSVASNAKEKIQAVEKLKSQFSIHMLCKTLSLNKSSYYHYRFRRPEKTSLEKCDEIFKPLISKIFEMSGERFGAMKIRGKIMEEGYVISKKRILRLMKEMNLSNKERNVYPNATFQREYKYYSNKLKQQFSQDAPNMVWVSDITYVKVADGTYYLCVVIDLFSRKVISYSISENQETDFVILAFKEAFLNRGRPEGLMFHSDQGAQYSSYEFRCMLRSLKVNQSYSRTGTPFDNAVAESFFRTLKAEEFKRNFYEDKDKLIKSVSSFIEYYNDYRTHQSLGYKTPNYIEATYYKAK
jgi:putative transposase